MKQEDNALNPFWHTAADSHLETSKLELVQKSKSNNMGWEVFKQVSAAHFLFIY